MSTCETCIYFDASKKGYTYDPKYRAMLTSSVDPVVHEEFDKLFEMSGACTRYPKWIPTFTISHCGEYKTKGE